MGRDHNEAGGRKPKTGTKGQAPVDFWSWHPTEAEKRRFEAFMAETEPLEVHLEAIGKLGIVLTITRAKTNDSACVVARNKFDDYGQGQALSVFNACPVRALWGMVFVLTALYPTWPAEAVTTFQRALDW